MNENKYFTKTEILINKKHLGKRIKKIASLIDKGKVLDIGCSNCYIYREFLCNKPIEYYGVDISKERVNYMNQFYPEINIALGNGEDLPFPKEKFDYVIIGEIIEHIGNAENFLRECKRVLKPNGKLIGSTPNATDLKRIINAVLRMPFGSNQHISVYGIYELKILLEGVGFKNVKTEMSKEILLNYKSFFFRVYLLNWIFPHFSKNIIFTGVK